MDRTLGQCQLPNRHTLVSPSGRSLPLFSALLSFFFTWFPSSLPPSLTPPSSIFTFSPSPLMTLSPLQSLFITLTPVRDCPGAVMATWVYVPVGPSHRGNRVQLSRLSTQALRKQHFSETGMDKRESSGMGRALPFFANPGLHPTPGIPSPGTPSVPSLKPRVTPRAMQVWSPNKTKAKMQID